MRGRSLQRGALRKILVAHGVLGSWGYNSEAVDFGIGSGQSSWCGSSVGQRCGVMATWLFGFALAVPIVSVVGGLLLLAMSSMFSRK
jgi:hypothetical protein